VKGLDTNVLVAWLLGAPESRSLMDDAPFQVSYMALAELVWVFGRVYGRSRTDVAALVELLLHTDGIRFESDEVVAQSLADFRDGRADFADYLLMQDGLFAGCDATLTFDRKAARHPGFSLLK
jgi:predicted nucleic-acid-binding protein